MQPRANYARATYTKPSHAQLSTTMDSPIRSKLLGRPRKLLGRTRVMPEAQHAADVIGLEHEGGGKKARGLAERALSRAKASRSVSAGALAPTKAQIAEYRRMHPDWDKRAVAGAGWAVSGGGERRDMRDLERLERLRAEKRAQQDAIDGYYESFARTDAGRAQRAEVDGEVRRRALVARDAAADRAVPAWARFTQALGKELPAALAKVPVIGSIVKPMAELQDYVTGALDAKKLEEDARYLRGAGYGDDAIAELLGGRRGRIPLGESECVCIKSRAKAGPDDGRVIRGKMLADFRAKYPELSFGEASKAFAAKVRDEAKAAFAQEFSAYMASSPKPKLKRKGKAKAKALDTEPARGAVKIGMASDFIFEPEVKVKAKAKAKRKVKAKQGTLELEEVPVFHLADASSRLVRRK